MSKRRDRLRLLAYGGNGVHTVTIDYGLDSTPDEEAERVSAPAP